MCIFPILFIATAALAGMSNAPALSWLSPNALGDARFRNIPFNTTGQLIFTTGHRPRRLLVYNKELHKNIVFWDDLGDDPQYQCGDIVSASGLITNATKFTIRELPFDINACFATNIVVIQRNQPFPSTENVSAHDINSNTYCNRFVDVEGVIVAVLDDPTNQEWFWIILRSHGERVRAAATKHDFCPDRAKDLIGAKVRLSGVVNAFSSWRRRLGYQLVLWGARGVQVLEPAEKPFTSQPLDNATIIDGRQRTTGHVLGMRNDQVFLFTTNGLFVKAHLSRKTERFTPGEKVTVSGFAENAPFSILLSNAIIRREHPDEAPLPKIHDVDPERMFTNEQGHNLADGTLYGRLIRVSGKVANDRDSICASGKIALNSGTRTLSIDITDLIDQLPKSIEQGCLAEICGICLGNFDTDSEMLEFPTFKGFEIIPRNACDIKVLRRAPFWTPRKSAFATAILLLLISALFFWNRSIHTLSERRAKRLAIEQVSAARALLKVEERTRLAVELHDALSQTLTGVALQLDAVNRFADSDRGKMANHLGIATRMLKSCRDELRNCLWDLRNKALEESDMNVAIRRTVNPFVGDAKLAIRFNISRDQLSDDAAHTLLRIIRELASNAVRHGQATVIRIAGALENDRLLFSVSDNGSGFDPDNQPSANEGHFGLDGIRERIERLSGTLEISSSSGQGTSVTISIQA